MAEKQINVGIRSIGCYVPQGIRDSAWIGAASGIPEPVIREKFGIRQVHKAGPEETVSSMGAEAARRCLGDFNPRDLDLVVYCGSEYKDYYLFNCAARVQYEIGAVNAAVFEIHNLCSAGVWSLKVLKSMMLQDPELKHVLLVSSSKEGARCGKLKAGDRAVLVSAGTGYTWAATGVQWGPVK